MLLADRSRSARIATISDHGSGCPSARPSPGTESRSVHEVEIDDRPAEMAPALDPGRAGRASHLVTGPRWS